MHEDKYPLYMDHKNLKPQSTHQIHDELESKTLEDTRQHSIDKEWSQIVALVGRPNISILLISEETSTKVQIYANE